MPSLEFNKHRIIKKQEKYTDHYHIHDENCMKSFKLSKKKGEGGFALSRFLRKKRCVQNLFILALTRKSFRDLFLGSEQHWRR